MILAILLGLGPAAHPAEARIVAVSMFKNGYAVVLRDIAVPEPGDYSIGVIPQGSMGTLWFTATGGATLDSVKTVTETVPMTYEILQTEALLAANKGKRVKIGMKNGDAVSGTSVTGKVLSVGADELLIKTDKGTLLIPKSSVTSVLSLDGDLTYKLPSVAGQRVLKLHVSGKAGHVSMVSLERGLTWSPGYAVDISDKKKLVLIAKSTVLNDLADMKNVDARFVTGFPYLPFADTVDPLVSGTTVEALNGLVNSPAGFAGGGGFGGGRGPAAARSMFGQNAAKAMDSAAFNPAEMQPMATIPGQQLEDLFFYRQGGITLGRGDRAYYLLFKAEAPYKEVYTWDIDDQIVNNVEYRPPTPVAQAYDDVWHTLQFKNTSGRPFTTAPATTFKEGQILGQDTMSYVSAGGDAELKITKALDVRAESSEEEVTRERGAIKGYNGVPLFDLVTMKGTLQATNLKTDPVTLRIRKDFTGELVSAEGDPESKKTAKGLRETNPTGRLTWRKTVESGGKLTLTFTYKVYVRSQ